MSHIIFTERAFSQYIYWQGQDIKTLKRINKLLKSIERDGALFGEGKPEKLKYRAGEYSRRINEQDRLVYEIGPDQSIIVKSCIGHYED